MNERQYDLINNDGGDGYNPYHAEREKREIEEAIAWGKTRAGRKDRIYRDLECKDCSDARECGTYNQTEIDDLRAQLVTIEAEEMAEFVTAWPLDLTKDRRASWNDRVRAGEFNKSGKNEVDYQKMRAAEREQGWSFGDLKKAVKLHSL